MSTRIDEYKPKPLYGAWLMEMAPSHSDPINEVGSLWAAGRPVTAYALARAVRSAEDRRAGCRDKFDKAKFHSIAIKLSNMLGRRGRLGTIALANPKRKNPNRTSSFRRVFKGKGATKHHWLGDYSSRAGSRSSMSSVKRQLRRAERRGGKWLCSNPKKKFAAQYVRKSRERGGPEEGGWYYDEVTTAQRKAFKRPGAAAAYAKRLRRKFGTPVGEWSGRWDDQETIQHGRRGRLLRDSGRPSYNPKRKNPSESWGQDIGNQLKDGAELYQEKGGIVVVRLDGGTFGFFPDQSEDTFRSLIKRRKSLTRHDVGKELSGHKRRNPSRAWGRARIKARGKWLKSRFNRNPKRDGSPTRGEIRKVKYAEYLRQLHKRGQEAHKELLAMLGRGAGQASHEIVHEAPALKAEKTATQEEFPAHTAPAAEVNSEHKFIQARLAELKVLAEDYQKQIEELGDADENAAEAEMLMEELIKLNKQRKALKDKAAATGLVLTNPCRNPRRRVVRRRGRRINPAAARRYSKALRRLGQALKSLRRARRASRSRR